MKHEVKTVLLGCRTPKMQHTNPRFKEGIPTDDYKPHLWAFQKRTSVVESDIFSRPDIGH
jgi:hypothetical protein